jgi:uncharacterized protein YgfB (UPF0149 family)
MKKPTVFIGVSTKGLTVARHLRDNLEDFAEVTIWDEKAYLGYHILEKLEKALEENDFAVLVFRADDTLLFDNKVSPVTRDNVLFESGLFMGWLGSKKSFIVYDKNESPKIIADLAGIIYADYDGSNPDLHAALEPASLQIKSSIKSSIEKWYEKIQKSITDNEFKIIDWLYDDHNALPTQIKDHLFSQSNFNIDDWSRRLIKLISLDLIQMRGGSEIAIMPKGKQFIDIVKEKEDPIFFKLLTK